MSEQLPITPPATPPIPVVVPLRFKRPRPEKHAAAAGLRYINDGAKGITRQRHGKHFRYLKPDGTPLKDFATLERIRKLAIPPAWEEVWICTSANGHLQATGRDVKGRKQYRYHDDFRGHCERSKFDRIATFAKALPQIRAGVAADLAKRGLPREKVLAAVVSLLEMTLIRVGNDDYVRQNGSFGLSTLRDKHMQVTGSEMVFTFIGKSSKKWRVTLRDRRLARIAKACQDLPGQRLFQYLDEAGEAQRITSTDINDYLRGLAGIDITAKDFRTWSGTVMAALILREAETPETVTAAKRAVRATLQQVAHRLGNTPTICRKCYVHPVVIRQHEEGGGLRLRIMAAGKAEPHALTPEERAVLRLIARNGSLKAAA